MSDRETLVDASQLLLNALSQREALLSENATADYVALVRSALTADEQEALEKELLQNAEFMAELTAALHDDLHRFAVSDDPQAERLPEQHTLPEIAGNVEAYLDRGGFNRATCADPLTWAAAGLAVSGAVFIFAAAYKVLKAEDVNGSAKVEVPLAKVEMTFSAKTKEALGRVESSVEFNHSKTVDDAS